MKCEADFEYPIDMKRKRGRHMEAEEKVLNIRISVRDLVEFVLRSGDIDNRKGGGLGEKEAMQEGSRIHRKIQGKMGSAYRAEVPLGITLPGDGYTLTVEGRADGIFTEQDTVWIDEIKSMYRDPDTLKEAIPVHLAQAKCYAHIYALQHGLDEIGVQMTYCSLETEEIRRFREMLPTKELSGWFQEVTDAYRKWAEFQRDWRELRRASIQGLEFPYPWRAGQKKLAMDVYRTILRKKNLFLQAPTGTGKTLSTVYPAVKAVGEGLAERIFYATAKTITRTVAEEAFSVLRGNGLRLKTLTLTAKEKVCPCGEMVCTPDACPRAKGHFDRVNDAVFEMLNAADAFDRDVILQQAEKWRVCPFEMSLDVSLWCDAVICDYNYIFDPRAKLKRFFSEGRGEYLFLVDEAHNLVDRGREMFSATLYKEDFLEGKRAVEEHSRKLTRALERCNAWLLDLKRESTELKVHEDVGIFPVYLMNLCGQIEEVLEKLADTEAGERMLELYFSARSFLEVCDRLDDSYVIYSELCADGRFMLKLYCVDISGNLQECINKGRSTVFFSATLLPIGYYKRLLSTDEDNYAIYAQSTFAQTQRFLAFGRDVSTKYTRRNRKEYEKIADYIGAVTEAQQGNYMVFFPSYRLMQDVYEVFAGKAADSCEILMQHSNMKEHEREAFLEEFEKERQGTLVAFCVMGGIFGEGIDLKNDRLIGAIIVGTGLPQVSDEREILKNYYDERGLSGFDYAFRYPGMNKVLQAAGRVIRTSEDRGVILLLDERFLQREYGALFPREWEKRSVCGLPQLREEVSRFWSDVREEL